MISKSQRSNCLRIVWRFPQLPVWSPEEELLRETILENHPVRKRLWLGEKESYLVYLVTTMLLDHQRFPPRHSQSLGRGESGWHGDGWCCEVKHNHCRWHRWHGWMGLLGTIKEPSWQTTKRSRQGWQTSCWKGEADTDKTAGVVSGNCDINRIDTHF